MIENSLPEPNARASHQNARALWHREKISEAVEEELERLREARPALESRIDRASSILLLQLASPPRTRPVKVRIHGDKVRFLVSSSSAAGAVYAVDARTWACSCPDFHRRNVACKHVIAAWILKRAARVRRRGCAVCVEGWVYLGETILSEETGEVVEATNVIRCRRCTPVAPGCLTDEELRAWMNSVRWKYAATMPRHPHEYHLKRWGDPETFEAVVKSIWSAGYDRRYLRRPWRSLTVGEHFVWVCTRPEPGMEAPLSQTILINRALQVQKRLV